MAMRNAHTSLSQKLLSALPYVMMTAVTAADIVTGQGVGYFQPLLSLGPAFASLTGTLRRTALIGVLALASCLTLAFYNEVFSAKRGYTAVACVAGVAIAGIFATAVRQRRERELANVRSIAEVAQRVLLRPVPRRAGHLRVAVSYTSAVAEARIGGDLYEVVTSPGGARVIVGDVQGKGLDAVETAAVVLGAFREAAHDEPDLTAVSGRLEKALNRHLAGEEFVTAVLVEVNADRTVTLLNYGHPPPLLVRTCGDVDFVESPEPAPPLGLAELRPKGPTPVQVLLAPGDQMLLYTDGVTEARDRGNRFYPLVCRGRLLMDDNPEVALEALRRDLISHVAAPLHDDAAMLLLRYRESGD